MTLIRRSLIAIALSPALPLAAAPPAPTFADEIAPMIHGNCTACHRPGEAAPFSLITYDDVRKRAKTIQRVIEERYMPPWHPVPGHGEFLNERRLSEGEIETFNRWVEGGKPQGDPVRTPAPPEFPEGWQLGEPDLVLEMNGSFEISADGPDLYRNFVIPIELEEDKWVRAVELRPRARPVVHHVLYFLDESGSARERDAQDTKPGFSGMGFPISGRLGGYAPGSVSAPLPGDLAYALPKGADLVLQTHFHPVGKAMTEQFTVGLFFADKPPSRPLVNIQVPPAFGRGMGIDIPPGESDYRVSDRFTIPVDVEAVGVGGHAHYVCREMKMTATLPDGTLQPLLFIDDWDLDWQDRYTFATPIPLPAGTVLETRLVYDNSADNPDNPFSPPRRIRWGRESTDEMGSITLMVIPADVSTAPLLSASAGIEQLRGAGPLVGAGLIELLDHLPALAKRADKNGDGMLQEEEVGPRIRAPLFERWDSDGDRVLDKAELRKLFDNLDAARQARQKKPDA